MTVDWVRKQYEEADSLSQRYFQETEGLTWEEIEAKIDKMDDSDPDKDGFLNCLFSVYFMNLTLGFIRYDLKKPLVPQECLPLVERLQKRTGSSFIAAYLAMADHDERKCLSALKKALMPAEGNSEPLHEYDFAQLVIEPFKNAIPGLYREIRPLLDSFPTDDSVKAVCDVMDAYYSTTDPEAMMEALYPVVQKFPDSVLANTLLAYTCFDAKRWGSSIAYFEKVESTGKYLLFFSSDVYFFKGWAYSKLNEHQNAVNNYERALEIEPDMTLALNNLGWEFYRWKKYSRALEIFDRCLKEERDLRFAPNNYVRTLLSMKQYKDAKAFVKDCPYKISKDLLRKVKAASSRNAKYWEEADASGAAEAAEMEEVIAEKFVPTRSAGEQFSSEKVLEDELFLRIESGMPVFGKKLKIYRRHGEYGRQYIIPIGRLDLFAEDDDGNLYIIELKKDSGYDDPYVQIKAYLEWFEKNFEYPGKIYGIICLNHPTEKLKADVRRDEQIRLYNYSINYHEVT